MIGRWCGSLRDDGYIVRHVACPGACCHAIAMSHTRASLGELAQSTDYPTAWHARRTLQIMVLDERYTDEGEIHRCTVFDGARCTEYEQRPAVCSMFPYGKECPYCQKVDGRYVVRDVADWLTREKWLRPILEHGCFPPSVYDKIMTYFAWP